MQAKSSITLVDQGISTHATQFWNLGTAPLVEAALLAPDTDDGPPADGVRPTP